MRYVATKPFSLKASRDHDEKWLQALLAEDETILGLGDIMHIESERRQNNGGRLDLMFQDETGDVRYCVDLNLEPQTRLTLFAHLNTGTMNVRAILTSNM